MVPRRHDGPDPHRQTPFPWEISHGAAQRDVGPSRDHRYQGGVRLRWSAAARRMPTRKFSMQQVPMSVLEDRQRPTNTIGGWFQGPEGPSTMQPREEAHGGTRAPGSLVQGGQPYDYKELIDRLTYTMYDLSKSQCTLLPACSSTMHD